MEVSGVWIMIGKIGLGVTRTELAVRCSETTELLHADLIIWVPRWVVAPAAGPNVMRASDRLCYVGFTPVREKALDDTIPPRSGFVQQVLSLVRNWTTKGRVSEDERRTTITAWRIDER